MQAWSTAFTPEEAQSPEMEMTPDERFATLVKTHASLLFRVAYSVLRNAHDAEEAVQEAFTNLYRTGAWTGMRDEKAFLARTVWRLALSRVGAQASLSTPLDVDLPSHDPTPEQAFNLAEERALLRRMLLSLPPELRFPLILSALDELTSREIAGMLEIPEGTVRTRVHRAKAELRKRFDSSRPPRLKDPRP